MSFGNLKVLVIYHKSVPTRRFKWAPVLVLNVYDIDMYLIQIPIYVSGNDENYI